VPACNVVFELVEWDVELNVEDSADVCMLEGTVDFPVEARGFVFLNQVHLVLNKKCKVSVYVKFLIWRKIFLSVLYHLRLMQIFFTEPMTQNI
jgi:hypothetical protein